MKKLILFLCFAFTTNAFAQNDSLIVLNKDVSIVLSYCTAVDIQDSNSDISLLFRFKMGTSFKALFTSKHILKTTQRPCKVPTESCYFTQVYTGSDINKFPKLFLKYIKKRRIYTVEISLNKLPIRYSKHAGGNYLPKSTPSDTALPKKTPIDPKLLKSSKSR